MGDTTIMNEMSIKQDTRMGLNDLDMVSTMILVPSKWRVTLKIRSTRKTESRRMNLGFGTPA